MVKLQQILLTPPSGLLVLLLLLTLTQPPSLLPFTLSSTILLLSIDSAKSPVHHTSLSNF